MNAKTYARFVHDTVVEFFTTAGDIGTQFHRDLLWIDVTDVTEIGYGWQFDGARFMAPVPVATEVAEPLHSDSEALIGSGSPDGADPPPSV